MIRASAPRSSPTLAGDGPAATMPKMIYGTAWKKDATAALVYEAIEAGFRALDTAAQPRHYREDLVGEGVRRAVAEGVVARKDLFVSRVSKAIRGAAGNKTDSNRSKPNSPPSTPKTP